jgi:hypothetical protein
LVLGTEPDIATEPFRSSRQEERDADGLASEFLIPDEQLETHLRGKAPIDAKSLERLAKAAKVSPVMAASRVVNSTEKLGLPNAAVVFFIDESEQWRYSQGLNFDHETAKAFFEVAMASKPKLVRRNNPDGKVAVVSIIDAQVYQVLFIQLLPANEAKQETYEERIRELGHKVFGNDLNFRQSVAARFGVCKGKCVGQRLDYAVKFFYEQYVGKAYTGIRASRLNSATGRKYVRLYFERWFS